MLLIGNRK